MKTLNIFIILLAVLFMPVHHIVGQECNSCDNECSRAYQASCCSAHWSAYVPIAALIIVGICFGLADKKDQSSGSMHTHLGPCKCSQINSSGSTSFSN